MSTEPKFSVLADARCVSTRPELTKIANQHVFVVARMQENNGDWSYRVCTAKYAPVFQCSESELISAPPIPMISDEEYFEGILDLTARLRYSVVFQGLRRLLEARALDPLKCLMIRCEQGYDVAIQLALPDGTLIDADYLKDSSTRQASSFSEWEAFESDERECRLAKAIVQESETAAFDLAVRRYFDATYAASDEQLPSV